MGLTIAGIQQAQQANAALIRAVKPGGAVGRAIQYGTIAAQRYAVGITHVDTGALKASHRMRFEAQGPRGLIYIDPSAVNPRSGRRTAVYGPYEHARGGGHAFYERVIAEQGARIGAEMLAIVTREMS